jgi:hypothetical protein
LDRILVGMYDYYTGLDMDSFSVRADFELDGTKPGENFAAKFRHVNPGVWEMKLARPVAGLPHGRLTFSVRDRQGNVSRIERDFLVRPAKLDTPAEAGR